MGFQNVTETYQQEVPPRPPSNPPVYPLDPPVTLTDPEEFGAFQNASRISNGQVNKRSHRVISFTQFLPYKWI